MTFTLFIIQNFDCRVHTSSIIRGVASGSIRELYLQFEEIYLRYCAI